MQDFVHLRLHTEFSVTDGILRINDAVELAASHQMYALPLTDLHNIGLVKFYRACRDKGIKPIIGAELNVQGDDDTNHYKILVLVKNLAGYSALCKLITRSYTENKILDVPHIKDEWILDVEQPNLIVLSGGTSSDIAHLIINNKINLAIERAKRWADAFPDSYYIELQRCSSPANQFTSFKISRDCKKIKYTSGCNTSNSIR